MAVTATKNVALSGPGVEVWDVKADQDADTGIQITHSLGAVPRVVKMHLITVVPTVWSENINGRTIDKVTLVKDTGTGSGDNSDQLRVTIERPHSIAQ